MDNIGIVKKRRLDNMNSTVYESLPFAESFEQFLDAPLCFRPHPSFINGAFPHEETLLTYAVRTQNMDAVDSLLAHNYDPNKANVRDITPLAAAAHKGNLRIIESLIKAGAEINGPNGSGSTALIQAAHFGHAGAVALLIQYGASADVANSKGTTALMRSCQEGHMEIVRELLKSQIDINRKNLEGMSALMLASQRGHEDVVAALLLSGAHPDIQTSQGSTALMLACKRGHKDTVRVLVSYGAEIYIRDIRNRTAFDTATKRGHKDLLPFLTTQYQTYQFQLRAGAERSILLQDLRTAHQHKKLKVSELLTSSLTGLKAMDQVISQFNGSNSLDMSVDISRESAFSQPAVVDHCKWPTTLLRIFDMPPGVFEHIIEYIPLPRVWEQSIERLSVRSKIAPHQAVKDTATLIDEILCDTGVFKSSNQQNLLIRLARSPEAISYFIEQNMSKKLMDLLIQWSDMQSLVNRTSDVDILFRPGFVRQFVSVALHLLKYYRALSNPVKVMIAKVLRYRNQLGTNAEVVLPPSILSDPNLAAIIGSILAAPSTPTGEGTTTAEMGRSQPSMNDNDDIITDAGGDEEEEDGEEMDSDDI